MCRCRTVCSDFIHIFLALLPATYKFSRLTEERAQAGNSVDPVKFSADTVPEAALPVTVGIDNR